nr:dTMP kinase [Chloroflexia bacterium]
VQDVIGPALAAGTDVVCDRFADSSIAYQGGGRGLDPVTLQQVQAFATGGLRPDVTLLLDLPVEVGLARRMRDLDQVNHLDREGEEFHRRVREAYHRLAAAAPSVWVIIDAARPRSEVSEAIRQSLRLRFNAKDAGTDTSLPAPGITGSPRRDHPRRIS